MSQGRPTGIAVALTILALAGSTGCVAFPFATPPLRVGTATGPRLAGAGLDAPVVTHVGVHPLQLDASLLDRPIDVGVGFVSEEGANHAARGAYLDGSFAFVRERISSRLLARGSAGLVFRLLKDDTLPILARGMGLRLSLEFATYVMGPVAFAGRDGGFLGYAFGELAAGLFVEADYTQYGVDNVGQLVFGVQFRLPATVGVAWAVYKGKKK
jgi:hypothetical protein